MLRDVNVRWRYGDAGGGGGSIDGDGAYENM